MSTPSRILDRRTFLRAGTVGIGFGAASACGWLQALAEEAPPRGVKSVIVLWMNGGPATIDLWDLKPGNDNGGPFREIETAAPGLRISEHLPRLAGCGQDLAIIRSMTTREGDHERATFLGRTGYTPQGAIQFPSIGSVLARQLSVSDGDLPGYVSIAAPRRMAPAGGGFLGPAFAPLAIGEGAAGSGLGLEESLVVPDLALASGVAASKQDGRLDLLAELDGRFQSARPSQVGDSLQSAVRRASRLMRPEAAGAFRLDDEPTSRREQYGKTLFGQGCLLARRLVERRVPFIEVSLDGWDTHQNNFDRVRELSGTLDAGFAALLGDLKDRGLLDSTLVVCQGEFGRTPKINGQTGRDHWPRSWAVALAGGGLRTGQAIGRTSDDGLQVDDRPVSIPDLIATVAKGVGIDPQHQNMSNVGRPIRVADPSAKPIQELL